MPTHHLPEAWIRACATDALGPAEALILATHAAMCRRCRARMQAAEVDIVRALLPPKVFPLAASSMDFDALSITQNGLLPWTVTALFGEEGQLVWTELLDGVHACSIDLEEGGRTAQLIRLDPGVVVPHHHTGPELAIALAGGWRDRFGSYRRGDVSIVPADGRLHRPRADAEQGCVALVSVDGYAVFDTRPGADRQEAP